MSFLTSLILITLVLLLQTTYAGYLFLQAPVGDRSDKLKFGQTTCISKDGRRIAVGANGFDKFRGALYVYDLASGSGDQIDNWRRTRIVGNDTRSAEEKKPRELRVVERGSGFGFSCAITLSGKQLIIGAPGHSMQRGAVYIFAYNGPLQSWIEIGKLTVPDLKSGDLFGWVVVASEDCETIAVSAKGKRANNGEVYIFSCEDGCVDCELSARLTPMDYTDTAGPRGIRIRNNFGISLAVNSEGTLLAVGCIGYNEERGAVYVYAKDEADQWNVTQRIESPNSQKFGFFGYKLSMDSDGRTLAVGADGEEQYTGAVYIFRKETLNISARDFGFVQDVARGKMHVEDNFGGAVALSGDGRALLVGAPGRNSQGLKDHGVTYVYQEMRGGEDPRWELVETLGLPSAHSREESFFGWNVGVNANGDRFVATAPHSNNGAGLAAFGNLPSMSKPPVYSKSVEEDIVADESVKEEL